jgi:peptidoglycan/xylan/chitin deacetylase (PgdA/CDA1 family)
MLDHHSELAIPPESYFLIPLWDRFRAGRDLEKLLADLAFAIQIREWGVDPESVRARLPKSAAFTDVIRAIYESYAQSRGKRRFGDKTPLYMLHLDLLEHAFERPVYLHIVRDGRDAALSYAAMPQGHPRGWLWPRGLADFACRWRSQVEGARRLGAAVGPDRYVELRYEDLVAKPAKQLSEVCTRIGLTFEDSMLEYHRDAHLSSARLGINPRLAEPPSAAGRSWRERMRPGDVERFEAVAGDLLDELGYERAFPRPSGRARARMLLTEVSWSGKAASMRLSLPVARRSPAWRWKQSRLLRRAGFPVPLNSAPAMAPILVFHAIENSLAPDSFPPDLFARGMAMLQEAGYRTIPLLDLVACLRNGARPPAGSFVLTFDDGYRSVYEHAAPILARYNWTATVFLLGGARPRRAESAGPLEMSGRPLLRWREIDEMRNAGLAFGAHTLTHPDLTRLSAREAEDEIVGSKAALEEMLGERVRAFAYPFGRYDASTREIVRRHFECACSDRLGLVNTGSDAYALERVDAYYLRRDRLFAIVPTLWFPLYVHARAVPRRLRRSLSGRRAR